MAQIAIVLSGRRPPFRRPDFHFFESSMGTRVGVFLRSRIWSTQIHPADPL